MRFVLLLCLALGVRAHYEIERTGHSNSVTQHKHPVEKLFISAAIFTAMRIITTVKSLWDRFNPTPDYETRPLLPGEVFEDEYDDYNEHDDYGRRF